MSGEQQWLKAFIAVLLVTSSTSAPLSAASELPKTKHGPESSWVCQQCHGTAGEGNAAARIPRIAGQAKDYLQKQLLDYKSGARDNAVMQNFTKRLDDTDRAQLADYFSALRTPYERSGATASADQWARGHQLAHQGAEAIRVQACDNCHGPDGRGVEFSAPVLAGQSANYFVAQLKAWQQGSRKNDAGKVMASIAERLSDSDMAALAAYFSNPAGPS
jgi:thiosulfate dehydrogenase